MCDAVDVTPKPMPTPPRQRDDKPTTVEQSANRPHKIPAGTTTSAEQPKPSAQRPREGGSSRRTQRRRAQRKRKKASQHTNSSTSAAGPSGGAPRHNKRTNIRVGADGFPLLPRAQRRALTHSGVARITAHLVALQQQVLAVIAELHNHLW